jgi:ribosomal protein S18 acetylase RimI-like enzyme
MFTDKTIILRVMRQHEFPAYQDYFIFSYSEDLMQNKGLSTEVANHLAVKSLDVSFGMGLLKSEHQLLCIERVNEDNQCELVGYLWHCIDCAAKSSYIYDFYIDEPYRSQGYGKQAIALLERRLSTESVNHIALRVAYDNPRALKLYQDVGFTISGYNMEKSITA